MHTRRRAFLLFSELSLVAIALLPLQTRAAGTWNDRSTACVAAITPAFVASILIDPAGAETQKSPAGDGCTNGTGLYAWKSGDRTCGVAVLPLDPRAFNINGEALMKKLGEVCNQLFALP